jgi:hypothetical protein
MNKSLCVISCPIDTYSGYGARSRDLVKAIIELKKDEWDIKIMPQRWGDCSWGFIQDNPEWGFLTSYFLPSPQLTQQPDIWMQITVPNEFQPIGKFNIGVTAGIETTVCPPEWIEGVNRMNTTWVSSKHSKKVFEECKFEKKDQQGRSIGLLQLEKPMEVVFEGADLNKYKILDPITYKELANINLDKIEESFCYLFLGHWINLNSPVGEDRKNVGLLIKAYFEVFKNKQNKPALILKTSGAVSSYMDRDAILRNIDAIKKTVNSTNLPNIYLMHGDFTDVEINELYNHPKVKAMVSLTKGEGFGRPLLEFSLIKKPIITTNWSGHTDFLYKKHNVLLDGELKPVHPAVANQFLLKESSWFNVNPAEVGESLMDVFKNYDKYLPGARTQGEYNKEKFSFEAMKQTISEQLSKVPEFPKQIQLKLPSLKKIELPKLQKI